MEAKGFGTQTLPVFSCIDDGLLDTTFSYIDNAIWQRGKHIVSFRVQGLRYQNNYPTRQQ